MNYATIMTSAMKVWILLLKLKNVSLKSSVPSSGVKPTEIYDRMTKQMVTIVWIYKMCASGLIDWKNGVTLWLMKNAQNVKTQQQLNTTLNDKFNDEAVNIIADVLLSIKSIWYISFAIDCVLVFN